MSRQGSCQRPQPEELLQAEEGPQPSTHWVNASTEAWLLHTPPTSVQVYESSSQKQFTEPAAFNAQRHLVAKLNGYLGEVYREIQDKFLAF